jgi:hypothetical protein
MARRRKRKTGITSRQKSARRKNIAVARSAKKKGGKKKLTRKRAIKKAVIMIKANKVGWNKVRSLEKRGKKKAAGKLRKKMTSFNQKLDKFTEKAYSMPMRRPKGLRPKNYVHYD